jgi:aryl-alcohol dehydrogenase-like predicted oxidoreductase
VDRNVPLAESLGELNALQNEGKIRHVAVSNVDVEQLGQARELSEVVSVQNRYSVIDRESDDVLSVCEAEGLGFLPWYPLGAGSLDRGSALAEVASRHGASVMQIALAWLLHRSPATLPIPGTSSVEHLEENVAAAAIELTDEDTAALDAT